jgi:hypothetical protein
MIKNNVKKDQLFQNNPPITSIPNTNAESVLTFSTEKLKATYKGEEYQFGIVTKIRCEKNQVNGIEQKGSIASTPHGYWNPDKIDAYKEMHKDFIKEKLNTEYDDFVIETELISGSVETGD